MTYFLEISLLAVLPHHGLNFKARRLKLGMQPLLLMREVVGEELTAGALAKLAEGDELRVFLQRKNLRTSKHFFDCNQMHNFLS